MLSTADAQGKPADRRQSAPLKRFARSKRTNGTSLFTGAVDERGVVARRLRDVRRELAAMFGDELTSAEALKVDQAATLAVQAELLQAALARGEGVDLEQLVRITNASSRSLRALEKLAAQQRRAAPGPTLADILAERTP